MPPTSTSSPSTLARVGRSTVLAMEPTEHPDPVQEALAERQTALHVRPDLPPIMTTGEVASFLRVHPETVRRYVEQGWLAAARLGERPDGQYRYRREDVLTFLEAGAVGAAQALGCGCTGKLPDAGPDTNTGPEL